MFERVQSLILGRLVYVWDRIPSSWRRRALFATNDHFLVGVVGILTDDRGRALLLEHRFRTPWRWGLPGGFVSRGETLQDAMGRELLEEVAVAVEVDPQPIDWEMNTQGAYLSMTLMGRVLQPPAQLDIRSAEISAGGFYGPDDLPEGLYPYHRALVLRYFAGEFDRPGQPGQTDQTGGTDQPDRTDQPDGTDRREGPPGSKLRA